MKRLCPKPSPSRGFFHMLFYGSDPSPSSSTSIESGLSSDTVNDGRYSCEMTLSALASTYGLIVD